MQLRAAVLFDNLGPYHLARLKAASRLCPVLAIQTNRRSRQYPWEPSLITNEFTTATLSDTGRVPLTAALGSLRRLRKALSGFGPDCVFVPGWSSGYSLAALGWSRARGIAVVMMSESTESDSARRGWKEWLKGKCLAMCSAALVGGSPQAQYVARLGMPHDRVFQGYDAVDNNYFARAAGMVRERASDFRLKFRLPASYVLASARFIEKKNLAGLLAAFAGYRRAACLDPSAGRQPWSLVLLGDGPLRPALHKRISEMGLDRFVFLPGFKQYGELPAYYGLAEAFVHASTVEPWGLVVNEAMASGLPVLVSNRCGCAPELVREGLNGFGFDPQNIEQITGTLLRAWRLGAQLPIMGSASAQLISAWGPSRFAEGFWAAANKALGQPSLDSARPPSAAHQPGAP